MAIINPRNVQNKSGVVYESGSLTKIYAEDYRVFSDSLGSAGSEVYLWLYNRTTTERNALTPTGSGNIIFNTTTGSVDVYNGSTWISVGAGASAGVSDHGSLTGLSDDDHTQYLLVNGTRSGSNLIVTGSVVGVSGSFSGTLKANVGSFTTNIDLVRSDLRNVKALHMQDPQGSYSLNVIHTYTGDTNGLGVTIQGGGMTIVGGGDAATTSMGNLTTTSEDLYLTADQNVVLLSALQGGWGSRYTTTYDNTGQWSLNSGSIVFQRGHGSFIGSIVVDDIDLKTGRLMINAGFGNNTTRPVVGSERINAEIAGYSSTSLASDDGFIRLSAGGGTGSASKTFIDLSGYSQVAEMNRTLVMGTAGVERLRIDHVGSTYFGSNVIGSGTFTATRFTGSHFGDGANLTNVPVIAHNHDGSAITTGTVSDSRLPTSMSGKTFTSDILGTNGSFTGSLVSKTIKVNLGANEIAQLNDTTSASGIWGTNIGLISAGGSGIISSGNGMVFSTGGTKNSMSTGTARAKILTDGTFDINNGFITLGSAGHGSFVGSVTAGSVVVNGQLQVNSSSSHLYDTRLTKSGNVNYIQSGSNRVASSWDELRFAKYSDTVWHMRIDAVGDVHAANNGSVQGSQIMGSAYITTSSYISYNAANQSLDFTIL